MTDHPAQQLALASEFPATTEADWRRLVDGVLKGAPFEKKLVTATADGIAMQPLHSRNASAEPIGSARGARGWGVSAMLDHPDPAEANSLAIGELDGGADSLILAFAGSLSARGFGLPAQEKAIRTALENVHCDLVSIRLDAAPFVGLEAAKAFLAFSKSANLPGIHLRVDFGIRPFASWAIAGRLPRPFSAMETAARETIAELRAAGFSGPFLTCDGRPFHEAGASDAQELASLLAQGVSLLRLLEKAGIKPQEAQKFLSFTVAVNQEQFAGIAKLRALRRLWAGILESCGAEPEPAQVHVETSFRMMTRRDPNVNMLRSTIAALAAGLGGADSLSVLPHSITLGLPDAEARRLARNTSLILLKESHLARLIDPAAGAGGIEALTDALEEKAWSLFQRIEAERTDEHAGLPAALENGMLAREIASTREARFKAIGTRRVPVTGVSEFPNISESLPPVLRPAAASPPAEGPFPPMRLSTPFETLRDRAEALAGKGRPARIFLAPLGRLPDFTPRATFAKNAYEAGGIEAVSGDGFALAGGGTDIDALLRAFATSGAKAACLVGADADYAVEGTTVAAALRSAGVRMLHLAGRPTELEPALAEAGVTGYLSLGMDLAGFLDAVLAGFEKQS